MSAATPLDISRPPYYPAARDARCIALHTDVEIRAPEELCV
ncbi:MAG: hypothetical protein QM692_13715 [Thermomicrobiales bacterium]